MLLDVTASVATDPASGLGLGILLIFLGMFVYFVTPRLDDLFRKPLFKGRRSVGSSFRRIGGTIFLGLGGIICIVISVVQMVRGH